MESKSKNNIIVGLTARNSKQLGNSLRRYRLKNKLTQKELAEKIGARQGTISAIESGKSAVRLETLFRIASGLELEIVIRNRQKDTW